jgi:apolipoprotein N-acyltransferase
MDNERPRRQRMLFALLSGVLIGVSYPPFPTGLSALIGFVPFLFLLEPVKSLRKALRYAYLTFFIFNLLTAYWAGGFTHGKDGYLMIAGALMLLAHPIFYTLVMVPFIFIRRSFGFLTAVLTFPLVFTAFEYCHSMTQLAFPWLMIANTQTRDLAVIQFASITGAYGISFWVVLVNVVFYLFLKQLSATLRTAGSFRPFAIGAVLFVLILLPKFYGNSILGRPENRDAGRELTIVCIQPNIDPFEKWAEDPGHFVPLLSAMTKNVVHTSPDLILWPETAIPTYLLHPAYAEYFTPIRRLVDSIDMPLLTGIADIEYYRAGSYIPPSAKTNGLGERYDTYNSSVLLQPRTEALQKYAKIRLVPFAERVPYSDQLSFLNAAQWNFGLGGWAIGHDTTIFTFRSKQGSMVKFANLICYESAFPGFVAGFVRKGAEFLTVITNDSWWGNTSGTYQHSQFGVLRAVENRRWVIQCANGGISDAVDPVGRMVNSTSMYVRDSLVQRIVRRDDRTFYTEHGDWFAEGCLILAIFITGAAVAQTSYRSYRRNNNDTDDRSPE